MVDLEALKKSMVLKRNKILRGFPVAPENPVAIIGLIDRLQQAEAERDALKAENEKLKFDADLSRHTIESLQSAYKHMTELKDEILGRIEAARKREPFAYCFTDVNGKPTQFTDAPKYSHHNDLRVITPLYASPVPAQQAAEPIAFTENDLLEIASSYSAYAGADGDMYLNGWVKSYEAKGFIFLINNRQSGQVMAEQLLKGGENER